MSLSNVNTIDSLTIAVTPSGGVRSEREYVAHNVQVQRLWRGEQWMTGDYRNHIHTTARHLVFTLSGSDIDQVSDTGNYRDPLVIGEDLLDTDGYTVEIYPDSAQSKSFEVIAFNPQRLTVLELTNMARTDEDSIVCITRDKVSRSDVEWFRKGFQTPTILIDDGQASDLVTFSRSSSGWYWGADGLLKEAATDEMRFDYDPASGELLGLLIEEARTNELLDSLNLSTVNWDMAAAITLTTGQSSVIEGQNSVLVDKNGAGGSKSYSQALGTFTGNSESFSVILEQGTAAQTHIGIYDKTASAWVALVLIDWSAETISDPSSGTAKLQKLSDSGPNGGKVFRAWITDAGTTGNDRRLHVYPASTSDVTGTIYHHHAQFEDGSFPSSPIITAGSAVTRSADVATVTDLSWYNDEEGAFVVDYNRDIITSFGYLLSVNAGSFNNRIAMFSGAYSVNYRFIVDGTPEAAGAGSQSVQNRKNTIGISYSDSNFVSYLNGVQDYNDIVSSTPTVSEMVIGSNYIKGDVLNGHIRSLHYYPERLVNSKLKQLTS